MKKLVSMLVVMCLVLGMSLPAFAQTIEDSGFGISFTLSDSWTDVGDESTYFFEHRRTEESIIINCYEKDKAYSLEMLDIETVKDSCNVIFSDEELANNLSKANNGANVNITTNYVNGGIEYHNGVEYYKYEKIYTVNSANYTPTTFYTYCYVTAQNGSIYFIVYERRNDANHFADLESMLDSLSYDLGAIKILINEEQIYPDVAPMIIEGRTMVPIRAVAEKMGYTVGWDGDKDLVTLRGGDDNELHFTIGAYTALKNGAEVIELDVAPFIVHGRTYLPLRAVAEAMDAMVDWDGDTKTVIIKK